MTTRRWRIYVQPPNGNFMFVWDHRFKWVAKLHLAYLKKQIQANTFGLRDMKGKPS